MKTKNNNGPRTESSGTNSSNKFLIVNHTVKRVRIRSYSGPYFPAFGLNTERYRVSLRIQSECGKIRTRTTPNTDTFYAVNISNSVMIFSFFNCDLTVFRNELKIRSHLFKFIVSKPSPLELRRNKLNGFRKRVSKMYQKFSCFSRAKLLQRKVDVFMRAISFTQCF